MMRTAKHLYLVVGAIALAPLLLFATGCSGKRTGGPCKYEEIVTEGRLLKIDEVVWTWETDALGEIDLEAVSMPAGLEVGQSRVLVMETIVKGSCVPYRLLELREK